MKLSHLLDISLLHSEIANGFISERPHPTLPLLVYNYTPKAQYDRRWNEATRQCRGLIVDRAGEVVARPFEKFFNHGERVEDSIPTDPPEVLEKLDGSLGVLYEYDDEYGVATRGSFQSDQARWASTWLKRHEEKHARIITPPPGKTALFEIISPVSRIVVPYRFDGLVLLAIIDNETGAEISYEHLCRFAESWNVRVCERYGFIDEAKDDFEGYVLTWRRENAPSFRLKIKLKEYVRLHRLLTQCNPKQIWRSIFTGQDLSPLFDDTPSDFQRWVRNWIRRIWEEFEGDFARAVELMKACEKFTTQKEVAVWLKHEDARLANVVHSLRSGKMGKCPPWGPSERAKVETTRRSMADVAILRMCEPRGDEPFRRDVE